MKRACWAKGALPRCDGGGGYDLGGAGEDRFGANDEDGFGLDRFGDAAERAAAGLGSVRQQTLEDFGFAEGGFELRVDLQRVRDVRRLRRVLRL